MYPIRNYGIKRPGPILSATVAGLFFLMLGLAAVPVSSYAATLADSGKSVKTTVVTDSIAGVQSLGVRHDTARMKEVIVIKLSSDKHLDSLGTLYVNGIPVEHLKPWKTNYNEKTLYFCLDENVHTVLLKFLDSSPFEKSVLTVYFGVGDGHKNISNTHYPLYVEVRQRINHWWIWVAAALLLILAGLGLKNNILKDDNNLYYSLGRTQLFYWTMLVLTAYLSICLKTDTLPDLPLSVLAILGISVATTAAAKLIENSNKDVVKIDKNAESEGLFLDILSDGSSINIQRFQNVAFNLFFGVIFLQKAFGNHLMPDFDQDVLILMGISSGTYAGLKNSEATKEQNQPSKPTGDDDPAKQKPAVDPVGDNNPAPDAGADKPAVQGAADEPE